jgi:hypothetical protein
MGTTIQPTDVEYVPVVATGCWVHMEHVAEGMVSGWSLVVRRWASRKRVKPITTVGVR